MQPAHQPPPTHHHRRRDRWLVWAIAVSAQYLKPLPLGQFWHEFLIFGIKQAWACLFAGVLIAGLLGTTFFYPADVLLARYDFLFLLALAMQVALLALKFERWDEAKVIALYHLVGTVMELFKTAKGSWLYPEANVIRILGVPLFSGFMYSTVGSYIARCWRLFDFRFRHYPPLWQTQVLALLIYVNFFTHHYIADMRWVLFALTGLIYRRTWIYFTCDERPRRMPLLLGFFLVAVFIWLAENIGTFSAIWLYPHQQAGGWHPVGVQKFGSWFLLMIISFVLVTFVHPPMEDAQARRSHGVASTRKK
jgi:uncharacterized membrane protein YoaT (DUF817 family)